MTGLFITFEGGEGCGKSTQIGALKARLEAMDKTVVQTREPGGTALGEYVRSLLQHDDAGHGMSPETELLLFAASRAQHVRELIAPAIAQGQIVLCDRFLDSTTVYQGVARAIDSKKVNRDASKGLVLGSAVNFYGVDVTENDVDNFYSSLKSPDPKKPLSLGLNSKLVREDGKLIEKVYRIGGMYSSSIEKIIYWLEKAKEVAENKKQEKGLELLIKYYNLGH